MPSREVIARLMIAGYPPLSTSPFDQPDTGRIASQRPGRIRILGHFRMSVVVITGRRRRRGQPVHLGNARWMSENGAWRYCRRWIRRTGESTAPGVAITLTVVAFNLLGNALRDALDPTMRD